MLSCDALQSHPRDIADSTVTGFYRQGRVARVRRRAARRSIAAADGTPLYVYSAATIATRYRAIDAAFASYPHAIHYALKANSTLAIVRLLRSLGSSADANSGGEIDVALRAGFIPPQIVFTGVGKTPAELGAGDRARRQDDQRRVGRRDRADRRAVARARRRATRIALRVNPDIDARSHPHISTGLKTNKFGIAARRSRGAHARARARPPGLEIVGLHIHVGSQITDLDPLRRRGERRSSTLARELRDDGVHARAPGSRRRAGHRVRRIAGAVRRRTMRRRSCRLSATPACRSCSSPAGSIVAPAGALLTRVVDVKEQPAGSLFVVMDAGMTELIRPMLYGAFHRIEPVVADAARPRSVRYRRTAVREQRHARARIACCRGPRSAICSRSSTPAPTDR